MSGSGEFCPRCGDTIEREETLSREGVDSALCDACYIDEYDLVDAPDRVQVRVCSQCGAVHRGNRWVDVGAEDYTDIAIDAVTEALSVHIDATSISWQVAPEQVDQTTIRMHCQFSGVLRETPVAEEVVVPVKLSRETCDRCGRIAGGSYASVVQVRSTDRDPSGEETDRATEIAHELVDELEDKGDREAFVTEVLEVAGGLDIKLSTNRLGEQVARRIVREFGGSYSDYETLVTEDADGNEVYRVTYAVHLPPYRPGEVIAPDDDGAVLVESVKGNLKGTRLTSGEHYEANYEDGDAPDADRLGTADDGEETTLVAVTDEHAVQVLHPDTYETKTVARPDYLDPDAETVSVIDTREGLFVLPE
ncbi:60S ribosomal export protein NMD3 [Halovenus salina]|uniref:60S ribosomal export protein NMD3 n=1 Tax=Halovenus salina TaxID=1510225 RepID=A0ABD5W0Y7_9EURY|nr:60S ribosomal export protein NMD3 [Halovenus salina]